MSAANDNGIAVRDLALPSFGIAALPVAGGGRIDLAAGGLHHAAVVTLGPACPSSGKAGKVSTVPVSNLRAVSAAEARAVLALFALLPTRGANVDRRA